MKFGTFTLKLIILVLVLITFNKPAESQRINAGVSVRYAFTNFNLVTLNKDYILPQNSFRMFEIDKKRQLHYTALSYGGGPLMFVDYGRYKMSLEMIFYNNISKFECLYPVANSEPITYIAEIQTFQFQAPLTLGYSFFNSRSVKFYAEVGAEPVVPFFNNESCNTKSDISDEGEVFSGILYSNKPYMSMVTGIGFFATNVAITMRYSNRINPVQPGCEINPLILNMQFFINFSKMQKSNLYFEKE